MSVEEKNAANLELSRVAFKAPPFWEAEPELWFHQLESQFVIAGITAEETKYHCVISALDSKALASVRDIIRNPPTVKAYESLKSKIVETFSQSESAQLKLLLQDLQLGDKRPSQLLLEMQNLSCQKLNSDILRTLWQQRLPIHVQQILSVCKDPINELALIADKICEISCFQSVSEVQNSHDNSPFQSLRDEISVLSTKVERLSRQRCRDKSRNYRYQRSKSRNLTFDNTRTGRLCWYHNRFGDKAHKCIKPCQFSEN